MHYPGRFRQPGHSILPLGAHPHWEDDAKFGSRLINARSETVASKPSFRSAFKNRRCLIPTTGFFEWKREGDRKRPYLIGMRDGEPFAFAGIWERWTDPEGYIIETCAILTTSSNELVGEIHNRMPVILSPGDYNRWLAGDTALEPLADLHKPYPATLMITREVTDLVNNPRCDAPECIQAVN